MSRDHALDATRTFAIWFMVVCHVARLITKNGYRLPNTDTVFPKLRPPFKQADLDASNSLHIDEFFSLFPNVSQDILKPLFHSCDTSQNELLTYK